MRQHRPARRSLVSVSGDGGNNEVVNGVMASGNANHHARVMHDEPLVELKKTGVTANIDLLKMTVTNDLHALRALV